MSLRFDSRLQKEQSQFRIQEISRKKKGGIQNKSHRYSVITYEKRVQLINLASSKGYSISRAARELGIKPSTGKFIVKCFRDNGKIMKKTSSQQSKSTQNSQEYSGFEMGDHKSDTNQKNNLTYDQNVGGTEKQFKQELMGVGAMSSQVPTLLFSYPTEQPVISQVFFCPSFQNFNGMVMPLFYPQTYQY